MESEEEQEAAETFDLPCLSSHSDHSAPGRVGQIRLTWKKWTSYTSFVTRPTSDMKYWCSTCQKTLAANAADNHSAEGHVIYAQADRPQDRPIKSK